MGKYSDYLADASFVLLTGATGTGKTCFIIKYMLNVSPACRFFFDFDGQMASRLKIPACSNASELERALDTRWVVFNPLKMFPGHIDDAFRFFCAWIYEVAQRGPGKKIVSIPEVWKYCTPASIPDELAIITQTGRVENIQVLFDTQTPSALNKSITQSITELVCFWLEEDCGLDWLEKKGIRRDEILGLQTGQFVARNCRSGAFLRGRVFEN